MQPFWVRLVLCVIPAAWAVFEFTGGDQFWGLMFALVAAYGAWTYLINYKPPEE
jgi:hypothetical protein